MISKNSENVMKNPAFIAEIERFRERVNSDLCASLSPSHKKLINQIPKFISLVHPFFYRSRKQEEIIFGMRKDGFTAYAAHPMNVVNIMMDFNFLDPTTLYVAAFHDTIEELDGLGKHLSNGKKLTEEIYEFRKNNWRSYFRECILGEDLKKFIDEKNICVPESFVEDIYDDVIALTPNGNWKCDFKGLYHRPHSFFVKCADSSSVNRDPEKMLIKYHGNLGAQVGKIDERINRIELLRTNGHEYMTKFSKERSLLSHIAHCQEFLTEFRSELIRLDNPNLTKDELYELRKNVQRNHPMYSFVCYNHRTLNYQ